MRQLLVGAGVIVALAITAGPASADTDLDFETPVVANCATVTGQYPGVTFVNGAPENIGGLSGASGVVLPGGGHSGTHVVQTGGCSDEFPYPQAVLQLAQTRAAASVWVRSPNAGASPHVQLRAYDAGGTRIDGNGAAYQTLVGGTGPWTLISAATADATNRIATVALVDSTPVLDQGVRVYLDDLHLTDGVVAAAPDFTLGPARTAAVLDQGARASVSVPINRLNGSTGAISGGASGLPSGMSAAATQAGDAFTVAVAAGLETPTGPGQFTLTGTPAGASSGPQPRSTAVPVFVRETVPTVTITDPAPDTLLDRVPFDPIIRGTATDPRVTGRVCVVTSHTADPVPVPATCDGRIEANGTWRVVGGGILPGANYLTAFVRDATGHVGRATRLLRVADETTGIDLRITGVQLSQNVQGYRNFLVPPSGGGPSVYTGVQLVQGKSLSVRVFANTNRAARSDGTTPRVTAHLRVFAGGRELAISPLVPRPANRNLATSAIPYATLAEQSDIRAGYRFELPASVTTLGPLTIQATINDTNAIVECPSCAANSTLRSTVGFRAMRTRDIYPMAFFDTFTGTPRRLSGTVGSIFRRTRQVYPFPVNVHPFVATVDVTADLREAQRAIDRDATVRAENWVTHYPGDYERDHNPDGPVIGVAAPGTYPGGMQTSAFFCCLPPRIEPFAVVLENRPLTSTAHEFGHTEGLAHSDHTCGGNADGQVSDDSWPDRDGTLAGIGIDLAGDRALPGVNLDGTSAAFDFMSYCAGEDNGWISTRNWDILAARAGLRDTRATPRQLPAAGAAGPALAVSAVLPIGGGPGAVTDVQPTDGRAQGTDPAGDAQLVVLGPGGAPTSATAVRTTVVHADVAGAVPALQVTGVVPAGTDPAAVQVRRGGTVAAARAASAHAPSVSVSAPRRGARVRGDLVVRWRGSDADGDPIRFAVDEAAGPTAPFQLIGAGFTGTSATIPASALRPAARARIRVRALDGFRQGVAIVDGVRIDAGPPAVTIVEPAKAVTMPADGLLALEGQAFDANSRALKGGALVWRLDGRRIATGSSAAATDLTVGVHRLTLTATALGARATAAQTVRVRKVTPRLVVAQAPAKLSATARSLVLRLATSVRSAARIAGGGGKAQTTTLTRRTRTVTVAIRPGTGVLRLRIALDGGGGRATETVTVARP